MSRTAVIASLLRWKNLVLILVSQSFFYYFFLLSALVQEGFTPILSTFDTMIFFAITPLIAAGGNIVNDLLDEITDFFNGRRGDWKSQFSRRQLWWMYGAINTTALIASLYLAAKYNRWITLSLAPGGILVLYLYSRWFEKWPFVGNAVVSLLCGSVIWVLFLPDLDAWGLTLVLDHPPRAAILTALFGLFACVVNFLREWAKDMEDRAGDIRGGGKTLAIVLSPLISRISLEIITGMWLLGMALGFVALYAPLSAVHWGITVLFFILPSVYFAHAIWNAERPYRWHRLSEGYKIYMVMGLILALILRVL